MNAGKGRVALSTQHKRSDDTNFRMSRHTDLGMRMRLGEGGEEV